jgi:hypothetical protein
MPEGKFSTQNSMLAAAAHPNKAAQALGQKWVLFETIEICNMAGL